MMFVVCPRRRVQHAEYVVVPFAILTILLLHTCNRHFKTIFDENYRLNLFYDVPAVQINGICFGNKEIAKLSVQPFSFSSSGILCCKQQAGNFYFLR